MKSRQIDRQGMQPCMEQMIKAYKIIVRKTEWERSLGKI
jgi:hypothetical protein